MSRRLLLQSILKFREGIKSGAAKVQDIVEDYFKSSGKSVTDEDRAIIMNEFAESAPTNVTPLKSKAFDEIDETAEGFNPDYMRGTSDTDVTVGEMRGRINYPAMEEKLGVKLRGNETFDELLEIEKNTKEEGLGSLFPKDKDGFDDRGEVAEFIKNMRKAKIKNKDIKDLFKLTATNIEQGKRAATTLARAADMGADTKIKQELLSELDEMKMDNSPRFFQEEYMGYDNFRSAIENKKMEVNNAIADDLELMGVSDEVVTSIMGRARETANKPFYTSGEEFIDIIKDELEFNDITNYDLEFYKNYFRELESLMRKPKPRFEYGGVV